MNNKEFTNELASRCELTSKDVKAMIDELVYAMADVLEEGASISVPGFGTFEAKKRNERVIIHPTTKQKQLVPPKLAVTFKPNHSLKDKANPKES